MEPIQHKAFIYDSHCPLCEWYTHQFIKNGLLEGSGRISFDEVTSHEVARIDEQRAKHEIPLVDFKGGQTLYGLDSLVHVLGNRFATVKRVMRQPSIYAFFKEFYSLVSYNRRVISGNNHKGKNFDCEPDFHLSYRWWFIAFAILVGSLVCIFLGKNLGQHPVGINGATMFPAMASSWLLLTLTSRIALPFRRWMDYIGHLATLLLMGTLLFLPWAIFEMVLPSLFNISIWVGMTISTIVMIGEHFRRVKNYGLPIWLNWVWLACWGVGFAYMWM